MQILLRIAKNHGEMLIVEYWSGEGPCKHKSEREAKRDKIIIQ